METPVLIKAALFLLFTSALLGQVSVEVTGVTSTQAVLQIQGATAPCVLGLHENDAGGPLHPDVPAETVDIGRYDTLTWQNGTRIVTLGHQRDNLALYADTTWYGTVSGCTETPIPFTFKTSTPPLGANWVRSVPFNPGKWNNADYPALDWSPAGRNKTYADPVSGLRMKIMNSSGEVQFLYGPVPLETWAGGEGWSNPAAAANGSTRSVATTSGTNPLDLYTLSKSGPFLAPWTDWRSMDNVGLVIFGSGSEGSGGEEDRKVDICLFFNPAEGCAGTPFRVTLPSGGVVKLQSTGTDSDRAFPAGFPDAMFAGWGGAVITHDRLAVASTLNAAAGALTIATPDKLRHFPLTLNPGNLMQIAGSGCSPNDLCTVTSNNHAASATVDSTFSASNVPYVAYPWGIRVRKVTSTGSVSIGFQHKFSGVYNAQTTPGGSYCHGIPVQSGDGIQGHACSLNVDNNTRRLYFLSADGMTRRLISGLRIRHSQFASQPVSDRPGATYSTIPGAISFGPQGNVFYASVPSATNKRSIFKLTYNGNWTRELSYKGGWGGDLPELEDEITWENLTPASQGKDLQTQIVATYPEYNTEVYGSWDSASFAGISGSSAFFYKLTGGQDGGPCWIASVDLQTGSVKALFNTLTGSGPTELMWGNCHSVSAVGWPRNTLFVSFNVLNLNSSSRLTGGPFEVTPNAVMRSGEWSSSTALPWPVDNSYDNTCPEDLSQEAKDFGAVGNQCVTLKLPGHPCNINPAPREKTTFPPCNWNSAYTQPAELRVTNHLVDKAIFGGGDSEPLRVVKVTPLSTGELMVVAQRNAVWDYCCVVGTRGPSCVNSTAQARHADGWTIRMYPGTKNSCRDATFFINFDDSGAKSVNLPRNLGGHSSIGRNGDNIDFVSGNLIKREIPLSALADVPVTGLALRPPGFEGINAAIGTGVVQQYLAHGQGGWALDANAYNPSFGWFGGNTLNNSLGARALSPLYDNVWKIGVIGTIRYKQFPLLGWVGNRIVKDISGPSSNIFAAPEYSLCHVLNAGECGTGNKGETFIKAPRVYATPNCISAMVWANVPCVVSAQPGVGGIRQLSITSADSGGANSRFLTYGFAAPGIHNPYWTAGALPAGKAFLTNSGQYLEGLRMSTLAFQLPEWQAPEQVPEQGNDTVRNRFRPLSIQLVPRDGATHARVKFGYNTALECTERGEPCITDTIKAPFAFQSEANAPSVCNSGCDISVPALSGRVLYYQAEWLAEGNVIVTGERTAITIP